MGLVKISSPGRLVDGRGVFICMSILYDSIFKEDVAGS